MRFEKLCQCHEIMGDFAILFLMFLCFNVLMFLFALVWFDIILIIKSNFKAS